MTLDEWKAQQDKDRAKVEFNIRKANEGADWKKGYVLHKSKAEDVSKMTALSFLCFIVSLLLFHAKCKTLLHPYHSPRQAMLCNFFFYILVSSLEVCLRNLIALHLVWRHYSYSTTPVFL